MRLNKNNRLFPFKPLRSLNALICGAVLGISVFSAILLVISCSLSPYENTLAGIEPTASPSLDITKSPSATSTNIIPAWQTAIVEDQTALGTPDTSSSQSNIRPQETSAPTENPLFVKPLTPNQVSSPALTQTSDLLFLSDGELMRWDHMTGYKSELVSGVTKFVTGEVGQRVITLRPHGITANGIELFDLAMLDFTTMQLTNLIEGTPNLPRLTLSPDENWITYIDPHDQNAIKTFPVDNPKQIRQLGACTIGENSNCEEIVWSPDNSKIIWSDSLGVWISELGGAGSRLVHPAKIEITDPAGVSVPIEVLFESLSWSPAGRYVLAKITPQDSVINWRGIIDTGRNRLVRIPDSYMSEDPVSSIFWSRDGSLNMLSGGDGRDEPLFFIRWRLVDTHDRILIEQNRFDLQVKDLPDLPLGAPGQYNYCIRWPVQSDSTQVTLGIKVSNASVATAIFRLDLAEQSTTKLFELPSDSAEVLWGPDGYGAIIIGAQNQVFYAPANGNPLIDLRPILGENASGFQWLPPAPRT